MNFLCELCDFLAASAVKNLNAKVAECFRKVRRESQRKLIE